ncbi:Hypothetical protein EIN_014760, partial [Entamoeba invadens IP1]
MNICRSIQNPFIN